MSLKFQHHHRLLRLLQKDHPNYFLLHHRQHMSLLRL
jgi:hypothetical protein